MSKNKRLIPELRFPEFEKDGEWLEKKLGDLGEFIGGGTPSRANNDYWKGEIPWISSSDIIEDDIHNISITEFINEIALSQSATKIIPKGSVLFVSRVGVGKFAINKRELCTSQDFTSFIPNGILNYFIAYYFLAKKDILLSLTQGTSIKGFSKSDLEEQIVFYPKNYKEQQKIASTLSSLDELIEAHSQKLDLLKDHKKGLMQNLFPQAGEKVPKFRFKEFEKDGEWVFKQFDEVFHFLTNNSFSRNNLNYENGSVKNIHYGDIHTKFSTLFDITKEIVPFINSNVKIESVSEENYCIEGDMVFADASEDLEDIGKSIEIINLNNEKLLAGLHTFLARQIELKLVIGFSGHLFKSNSIRNQIKRESQGTKVLGISKGRISNIKIYYPENKFEQEKIASTLSSLDEMIQAQVEKIDQLKEHKKGLMQGLFPKSITN